MAYYPGINIEEDDFLKFDFDYKTSDYFHKDTDLICEICHEQIPISIQEKQKTENGECVCDDVRLLRKLIDVRMYNCLLRKTRQNIRNDFMDCAVYLVGKIRYMMHIDCYKAVIKQKLTPQYAKKGFFFFSLKRQ